MSNRVTKKTRRPKAMDENKNVNEKELEELVDILEEIGYFD